MSWMNTAGADGSMDIVTTDHDCFGLSGTNIDPDSCHWLHCGKSFMRNHVNDFETTVLAHIASSS
ncbi:protein of unknown function [Georgfuchsia toluolica]|uniref:Uncharacterized protein n=1 Tax=Georgfuchsia toluolica TaxID=424218 RepID=A0A916J486_9PROT|nr:protein of unknown function [Georgfuchsia toluolica]